MSRALAHRPPLLDSPDSGDRRGARGKPRKLPAGRPAAYLLSRALLVVGPPMLLLMAYLMLCTGAVSSGHYRNDLQSDIRQTRDEIDRFQAEVRRLQSPARIFTEAEQLGMERPTEVAFTPAPVSRKFASGQPTTP